MNIVNKLTIRHLKNNKRRTLVTIIGVIISVAMIMAVATLGVSFLDLLKRQVIEDHGEWHVLYEDLDKQQLEAVKNDKATKDIFISRDAGYAYLEGSKNENKPYVYVKEYDQAGFGNFPIELSKGRLPQASDEIVLADHIASNAEVEYEIGDQITLEIGERYPIEGEVKKPFGQYDSLQKWNRNTSESSNGSNIATEVVDGEVSETIINTNTKTYTVVGFIERPTWEPTWAPGYTSISYIDESMVSADNRIDASVVLNKVNNAIYDHAEQLVAENNISSVSYNSELLRYYGVTDNDGLRTTLFSLVAIIMAVIVVGSVALIYNAFAISVSERARHLGMLSSVGATKKQKRNSVIFEGMVIGSISIPIGIIAGLAGMGITFLLINSVIKGALRISQGLQLTVTPLSILVACGVSMVTIFISTYLPARKASKISAIDAIRQTQDVKLTGRKVKTSKFVRKLFGIEAEFGLKNLKRNKRRYQVTVFSLVISILLFLTVSFFTDSLKKSIVMTQGGQNYDIQVYTGDASEQNLEQLRMYSKLDTVTNYSISREMDLRARIDKEDIGDGFKAILADSEDPDALEKDTFNYFINVYGYDQETLTAYAEDVGVDVDKLLDPENPAAIVFNTFDYQDPVTRKFIEVEAIKADVGENLDLYYEYWDSETATDIDLENIEILSLTDQYPMGHIGAETMGLGNLSIIVSDQIIDQLIPEQYKSERRISTYLYLTSSDPMRTQEQIEEQNDANMYVYNVYQTRQQEQQMILMLSVFTYGFIALITSISVANIFNTISTSISLRRREFAMLKSVGMTPKGFNKMINYESIFYGMKALAYGLPLSIGVMYLIHRSMQGTFEYNFALPWQSIAFVITAIFIIVGVAMLYSIQKVKKENIIDALKQENI